MSVRMHALNEAKKYVGTAELPPGSNRGAMIDKWNKDACGLVGVYWCASFVHGMYKAIGYTLPGFASVEKIHEWAKTVGVVVARPFKGDLALYSWDHPFQHIGIVERVLALRPFGVYLIQTIEGNTSSGVAGSQDNGGGVYRRRRWVTRKNCEFVRVPDPKGV